MSELPLLSIEPLIIGGTGLWAIALYLGFFPTSQRLTEQLSCWLKGNEFWASLVSVLPFIAVGGLSYYGLLLGLGQSWAISLGVIACVGCGVYELGRRDGEASRKGRGS